LNKDTWTKILFDTIYDLNLLPAQHRPMQQSDDFSSCQSKWQQVHSWTSCLHWH